MTRVLLFSFVLGIIAAPAYAQAPAGSCKPVFDAMLKQTSTPHHIATTVNGKPIGESIATADASYVKINGAWEKTPMSLKDATAQQHENINAIGSSSCSKLPDDAVDGKPAAVFQAHYDQKDRGGTDAKIWISKTTGLPLQTAVSMQNGKKVSVVTKLDYDNIKAPIGK